MTDQLDLTGLSIDTLEERTAAVHSSLRSSISPVLDVSEDQPIGQITRVLLEHVQQLAELIQEVHAGLDPDEASGQTLDAVASITGTYRRPATYGTASLTLTFTGAATVPAGSLVASSVDATSLWALDEDVVATGAGDVDGAATCTVVGPVAAAAGELTVISTPVAGWSAVTNAADASEGLEIETDTELRLRREIEVPGGGSGSIDSIVAEVRPIDGVLEVLGLENTSWRADAPMPPHSFEIVFWSTYTGATLTALEVLIAAAIFRVKAASCHAYGSTEVTHTDDQGIDHVVGMTLADELVLELEYTIETSTGYTEASFKAAVVAALTYGIGDDVLYTRAIAAGYAAAGVENVVSLTMTLDGVGPVTADIAVGLREIATLDTADITVVVV